MLEAIERHAKKDEAVDIMKAIDGIELMNELFDAQVESYKTFHPMNNPNAWQKPIGIAAKLSNLFSNSFEYNQNTNTHIIWVVNHWGTKEKLNLKEIWESFYKEKKELEKDIENVDGQS
jgi:hypothetical protein